MNDIKPLSDEEIDWQVTVCDGKYTVQHAKRGSGVALRYNEPWRDLCGDHLIFSLGLELHEALDTIKARDEALRLEKIYAKEKDSTATVFMNQVKSLQRSICGLQEQLRLATERAEIAVRDLHEFRTTYDLWPDHRDKVKNLTKQRDQLTADNQRLREALKNIIGHLHPDNFSDYHGGRVAGEFSVHELRLAFEALNSTHPINHLTDKERVKKEKELSSQDIKLGGDCEHGTPQGLQCSLCEVEAMEKPL